MRHPRTRYGTQAGTFGAAARPGPAVASGTLTAPHPAHELASRTAGEVMITHAKTLPLDTTLERAGAAFGDPHVHMLLLARDGVLHGTLLRRDLVTAGPLTDRALCLATLTGRTTAPDTRLAALEERLLASDRRLAVVDAGHRLLGLLCLKRHHRGFCTDQGVLARAHERNPTGCESPPDQRAGRV